MLASVSHRSGPPMASNRSKGSSMSGSSMPFTKSNCVPHPLQMIDNQQETSVMDTWTTSRDDPVTPYTFQPTQLSRSLSQRHPDLEQLIEIDSGDHPEDFFARTETMPIPPATLSPIEIPPGGQWRSPTHRGSTSRRRSSFGIQTPTTPSSAALTSGTTLASEMSRQNSLCNDTFLSSLEMMNVHSNTSIYTDNSTDETYQSGIPFPSSPFSKLPLCDDQPFLLTGTGGASEDTQFSSSYQDYGDSAIQFSPPSSFVGDMRRQHSNESNSSSTSATRAAAILKRQNQLSTRLLAPKACAEEVAMSREGSHPMVTLKSKDGLENRAVAQITKQPYQRPKHDRVFCNQCNEYPDGFRGPHELGRHQDRQHREQVKKFVCVEPADGIINDQYRPVYPLSKCKACSQQKKKYGAYYNAAAHLRRAHFKPKTRSRGKCAKLEEKSEKRGGKGGGDWPPMLELKRWMKEVYEQVAESQPQDAEEEEEEEEEEDVEDDDCSGSLETDDSYAKLQGISNISSANSSFDSAYLYADTTMIDAYAAPASNFNTQRMPNMQYDNLTLTQSIERSMRIDSSQPSFADSHFATNDTLSFIDFPQNFDEHGLVQDSFHTFQYQM